MREIANSRMVSHLQSFPEGCQVTRGKQVGICAYLDTVAQNDPFAGVSIESCMVFYRDIVPKRNITRIEQPATRAQVNFLARPDKSADHHDNPHKNGPVQKAGWDPGI